MKKISATEIRNQRRRNRSKGKNVGHPDRPRLVVYRSNKHIRAQIIDDLSGSTLAAASSLDKNMSADVAKAESKTDVSVLVGTAVAERAIENKVSKVVFDRNGHPYQGRVKAVADAARKAGLEF
ncbi:MAG: 50S ribosomal protein L18 [Candidatus Marinimicrobia bacterium]|jgi:large subunit ribosomal protein L18|nr:50S ribosomal protein L18 [Candidatus Neomarinimicrobiota bacterium]MBT3676589.1 50S ribosomal protein L18 [Candidatus Neomarinimicrobiota bacterium]MBT3763289.1 50S ribosomal protein L18 [Candidatus Neomarinimicrobiota bacterium]MBT4067319.1 50S ribosomal protein L18 [Candidatus Neomarinimicrobiota bacterium]MBT4270581.1 50S ribosomal protein L18 [Candidatus Neomarinimicrobiota bacterium]